MDALQVSLQLVLSKKKHRVLTNILTAYKFPKAQERLEELKRGGSKVQMKRERLSRTNQKQQEENCTVM
jgi:hypothetical protein